MESRSTEEEKMPHDQDEIVKHARDHAWDWFVLHAGQRMQSFNYFIVATAFLTAGYASLLEKHPEIAVGVALMGAWIAIWFNRLDRRTKQLIRAGENALEVTQARLAERAEIQELKILESVKQPVCGASSYSRIIAVIEWTITFGFVAAATYAGWLTACVH
jgi:hypothetical protein